MFKLVSKIPLKINAVPSHFIPSILSIEITYEDTRKRLNINSNNILFIFPNIDLRTIYSYCRIVILAKGALFIYSLFLKYIY